ncbi:Zinc/iron regulated transporter-related protein 89B [Carabus blaptoides fortunei]
MISLRNAENEEVFEDTVVAKAVAMTVLCVASLTMGLIPLRLTKWFRLDSNPKGNVYITMLLAMGGGVLLCTTFLHLLPEVTENIQSLQESGELPELPFHLAELLMCVGFFTMYLVEEIVHRYIHKAHRKSVAEEVLRRTVSIRRKTISGSLSTTELTPATLEDPRYSNSHMHAGHSHIMIDDSTVTSLRGLLVVLALSIHELFEGLAVGLESSSGTVWYMFGAVSCHKLVIAFCIGVELISNGTKTVLIVVSSANIEVSSVFLQGLASGTLLYVVFFEILQKERTEGLQQYLSILVGFLIMFGLTFISSKNTALKDRRRPKRKIKPSKL